MSTSQLPAVDGSYWEQLCITLQSAGLRSTQTVGVHMPHRVLCEHRGSAVG